ncbi:MAG: hypothetical protein ACK5ZG_09960 [Phycisphaerae bacterium]|jgi:hypothetical protein
MHAGNDQGEWAQPFDLGDGLEPVVLTRTRDFTEWPRSLGMVSEWFVPMLPRSLLLAIGLVFVLVTVTGLSTVFVQRFGTDWMWLAIPLAIIVGGVVSGTAWRRRMSAKGPASGRVATIDVRRANPSARLRVIGDREHIAKVLGYLPATDEMREPVFLECMGVYGFAQAIEDLAASARRVMPVPRVSKREPWFEGVLKSVVGIVLFITILAAMSTIPGMRIGFWPVVVSMWCAWALVASFNPVTIRVMPGCIDVFQSRMFRRTRIQQSSFDLTLARVTLDVNRGVVRVEDPTRAEWPGLYVRLAGGPTEMQAMADVLHAARTQQRAPHMPSALALA